MLKRTAESASLSPIQDLMADLAADLIQNGGAEAERAGLAEVLLNRYARRLLGAPLEFAHQVPEVMDFVAERLALWTDSLPRESPYQDSRAEPVCGAGDCVGERIRANLRGRLEEEFEKFVATSPLYEAVFLREVLVQRNRAARSRDGEEPEFLLASCFEHELGSSDLFLRIPEKYAKEMRQYLSWLESLESDSKRGQ